MNDSGKKLWQPTTAHIKNSNLSRFVEYLNCPEYQGDYDALWQWSIREPSHFWKAVWEFTNILGERGSSTALELGETFYEAKWFPDAQLNYAENLLRERPRESEAIIFQCEDKIHQRLTFGELYDQVSSMAQALQIAGVTSGDRVAGVLPNCPQTIIAMLATVSLGAVWSSCSPDFGVNGIVDRFSQIEPKILFVIDGYYYNGKWIDCTNTHKQLEEQLPTLKNLIISSLKNNTDIITTKLNLVKAKSWQSFVSDFSSKKIDFHRVSFQSPLFIMFSSGTTSVPKCIVHSHGGVLLQHLKEHQLHADIKPEDRVFYFTTCGWMMWNWLVSALASKAVLVLYDGSPFSPTEHVLFDYVDAEAITHFGTSAKYIDACQKAGLQPIHTHLLNSIRLIMSTGSVLVPSSFEYVYQSIKHDVCLSSISGGTDIVSCFALGCIWLPVYKGELQCRGLGMDVAVYNESGTSIIDQKGELVCQSPFPSQPIGFWNDENNEKYRKAYFMRFPNIWCQGDYVELTSRATLVFYGRSDAVLNPGGVRIGTAEIYRQVESMPEILESIAIGQEWDNDIRVVLFVKLQPNNTLDESLTTAIKKRIRINTTPRHVPTKIIAVDDIPRTKSGKIVEIAVKKIVHNESINNVEALANPEALELFKNLPELQY